MSIDGNTHWQDDLTPTEVMDIELEAYEDYLEGAREQLAASSSVPQLASAIAEFADVIAAVVFGGRDSFRDDGWPEWLAAYDLPAVEREEWEECTGEPTLTKYVSRLVECRFAKELIHNVLSGSFQRFARLAMLVGPPSSSNWTGAFIKHVGRCYVHRMNAECVIMCRSVLDSEFQAEISHDDCVEVLRYSPSGAFTLSERIRVAEKLGRISFESSQLARSVCQLANEAVHRHPGRAEREDPYAIIQNTVNVLRALHGNDEADEGDNDEPSDAGNGTCES